MKMDKWNGTYREWYSDGMPKLVGEYLDGKQHGGGSSTTKMELNYHPLPMIMARK